jgi:glycosyltransferase involved in cell wall biosynthesis
VRAETLAARVTGAWVRLRSWQTSVGKRARRRLDLPGDRLYTLFWRAAMKERAWRRLEPGLWEYELAYGPVVDELRPDIIHANDFRMLGVGARAVIRGKDDGRRIRLVWDAHEYLPGVEPWQDNMRWRPGNVAHEREFAPFSDAVITVSESLAELLQRDHKLPRLPEVVLNAPDVDSLRPATAEPSPSIRKRCGLGPDVPLLVYSGLAAHKRGINVMIEALPKLPDVHVALVVGKINAPYVLGLIERAKALDCADRLHVFGYVPHDQVVSFLASANVGVIPIRHFPNHEIALITKFFEYSHARLPIVVSDVRTMAETVRKTGQGEVFRVDDVEDYVRAVRAVLADEKHFRAAYDTPGLLDEWTWRAQAAKLNAVYAALLGDRA